MSNKKPEAVVFIHGLFMNGWDMAFMRNRIEDAGFVAHQFSYSSTVSSIDEVVQELYDFVEEIDAGKIHYVGHSLGGLVIRHFLHAYPKSPKGRVVTLGTPHQGSGAAHVINQFNLGSMFLGESLNSGLLGNTPDWAGKRELGSIAGDVGIGMGMMFSGLDSPNDGTVSVEETLLENSSDHIQLSVSHTGLVLSKTAADETLNFLKKGQFTKN